MTIEKILLFRNKNKKEQKQPDWRISFEVDGKLVDVAGAWDNSSQQGEYISGKVNNNVKIAIKVEEYKKSENQEEQRTGMNAGFSNPEAEDKVNLDKIPF